MHLTSVHLPIHPFTRLRAVGVLPSGRIVWPVLGGNGEGGGDGGAGSSSGGSGSGGGSDGSGAAGAGDGGGSTGAGPGQTFTQADLDRIVGERLARERTKYADYDALKAKATEYDELKAAQASDAEKAVAQARKDTEAAVRGELEPRLLRLEVALAHGLPDELGKKVLSAAKRLVGMNREELEVDAKEFFAASPIQMPQGSEGGQGGNNDAGQGGNDGGTAGEGFDQGARGGRNTGKPTVAGGRELYKRLRGGAATTTTQT